MKSKLTQEELSYLVELVVDNKEQYSKFGYEKRYCAWLQTIADKLIIQLVADRHNKG